MCVYIYMYVSPPLPVRVPPRRSWPRGSGAAAAPAAGCSRTQSTGSGRRGRRSNLGAHTSPWMTRLIRIMIITMMRVSGADVRLPPRYCRLPPRFLPCLPRYFWLAVCCSADDPRLLSHSSDVITPTPPLPNRRTRVRHQLRKMWPQCEATFCAIDARCESARGRRDRGL